MQVLDSGPFFHGTKADLHVGDLLSAGFTSNYKDGLVMNHIYFTALSKAPAWPRRSPGAAAGPASTWWNPPASSRMIPT
jgi:hypothetical protein